MADREMEAVIKALGSPVRREILWRMADREASVAELADGLGVSGPTLSEHLSVLRAAGLASVRPQGTRRLYRARAEMLHRFRSLFDDSPKWDTAKDHPENALAQAAIRQVVVIDAEPRCSQAIAFEAFTNAERFSRWLGADVAIDDGHFRCRVHETGSVVRGTYTHIAPPSFICMDWDFHTSEVPVPGASKRALFMILPLSDAHCRIEVTQFAASTDEAEFLATAWRYVLGSFCARIDKAVVG